MSARLVVEADGGSRGNPGVAGYGALVRSADGTVLVERAAPLGKASNNVAEYTGLIRGLEAAIRIDPGADIEVRMDSKLVVEQMAGRWKIKHEDMRRLALEARDLCTQISDAGGSVIFTWIPRASNGAADKLSNDGMDGHTVDRDLRPDSHATTADAPDAASATDAAPATEGRTGEPDLTPPTRLILVRHAVSAHTTTGHLDGRGGTCHGLTDTGHAQAAALATRLRTWTGTDAHVITSSIARAVQTGAAVAERLGVASRVDPDWDEQGFGTWDGRSLAQIAARWPDDLARLRTDPTYAPEGGESHDDVTTRVRAAVDRALTTAGPGGTTIVVAHRKPIFVALADVLRLGLDTYWKIAIAPASISEIDVWRDGATMVRCVNDAAHLP